ncbi:MAG: EamA family transporter [Anaerolineae bacterium]|nr:EamA family transporter [Thermoflexales bacterium]MDW8396067.1 EamA family transporter [Anaerolineae bacterium]
MSHLLSGSAQVFLAAALWGTFGVSVRLLDGLAPTDALSVGFFRLAFSAPALGLAGVAALGRQVWRVERRDLPLMALVGAMMALYQVCYVSAVQQAGVTLAVLVTLCSAPAIVAVLAGVFLKERLTLAVGGALAAALVGTALLVNPQGGPVEASRALLGAAFALGAATAYAVVTLLGRAFAARYHPLQPLVIGFPFGAALLLAFALPNGLALGYPPLGWGILVWLGLGPTALAYVLFFNGMKRTPATAASVIALAEPLTATTLAAALFGERLGATGGLGAALLVAGVLALLVKPPRSA